MRRAFWRRLVALRTRLFHRRRYDRLVLEDVDGMPLLVLPQVFNPKLMRSGAFLARHLSKPRVLRPGARVLDLGTGSGVAAVAAARAGCSVTAVEINPAAVRCARINALLNHVEHHVEVREGDLFAPVAGERFDVIVFNPPYYRGAPRSDLDYAWRALDIIERFAANVEKHLNPHGHALLVLSSDGEHNQFIAALQHAGMDTWVAAERDFLNEQMWIYRVSSPQSAVDSPGSHVRSHSPANMTIAQTQNSDRRRRLRTDD